MPSTSPLRGHPICDLCGGDEGTVNVYAGGPFFAMHPACAAIGSAAIRKWAHYIRNHPYGFQALLNMMQGEDMKDVSP